MNQDETGITKLRCVNHDCEQCKTQRTWQGLMDEHPLMVFAKECVLGAYQESELADSAKRAIEAAHGIKE